MRVLVVGGGGREHAMGRALATTPGVTLMAAPGNPGTAEVGRNLPIEADDVPRLVEAARREQVDLVIPGPEIPLVAGLGDALGGAGIPCAGPNAAAARLEGSKAFARRIAAAAGVPSPRYRVVGAAPEVAAALAEFDSPPVVKADGLAGGKGVFLPDTVDECAEIASSLLGGRLGAAGATVILEERLIGAEASLFHACRGVEAVALPHAMDHKRLEDGDRGPNTGGMGAVSPNPIVPPDLEEEARRRIVLPTLQRLAAAGTPFHGFLFTGLMLTASGPVLLEFNVRLGDPEAQVVLPRLSDGVFADLCAWVAGTRDTPPVVSGDAPPTCAVVLAAAGYPEAHRRGDPITLSAGLETADRWFIHAGTRRDGGTLLTNGGRVGAVVARGATPAAARNAAYSGVTHVQWEGMTYRSDIGRRGND